MKRIVTESPAQVFWPHEPAIEQEFEDQILRCAEQFFPSYFAGFWKPIIKDGQGRAARPDVVLISKEFESWYVVEVELAHHSLRNHIVPQLETLSQGIYDRSLVDSLAVAVTDVPIHVLQHIVYRIPGLLCISNMYTEGIHAACRDYNFEYAVFEPYRGESAGWALHATKVAPIMQEAIVSGRYQLRRGEVVGDREFLELPRHFPNWQGSVRIIASDGEEYDARLHGSDTHQFVIVPVIKLVPSGSICLVMVDRSRRLLRLEVGK